jgi:Na+-translocating ferredoxin:NAD+ oxidoreductase subunit B
MATVLAAVIIIAFAGLGFGLAIGYVAKAFAVEVDPRLEEVTGLLPGVNCGGCGFAGCAEFAKVLVAGQAEPGQCPVSSAAVVASIAAVTHLSVKAKAPQVAVVFCGGDVQHSQRVRYNGVNECLSAALVASGGKACGYGCMGYGSCAQACPFGAIELRRGLAVVHPELCTGCGQCVAVCPRKLIRLVPASAGVHILCSAKAKPVSKRKLCQTACIACKKCVRAAPGGHWLAGANLIQVNYANPPPPEIVAHAGCPTGCLKNAVDHVANRERT